MAPIRTVRSGESCRSEGRLEEPRPDRWCASLSDRGEYAPEAAFSELLVRMIRWACSSASSSLLQATQEEVEDSTELIQSNRKLDQVNLLF